MMNKKNKILIFNISSMLWLLFLLKVGVLGCRQPTSFDPLFKTAEEKLGKKHCDAFKNLPIDSVMLFYVAASDTMKYYLFTDSTFVSKIIESCEKNAIRRYWAGYYFGFSFHNYLNHVEEGTSELLEKSYNADKKNKEYIEIEKKEESVRYNWITLSYFNKCSLGDTIQFVFPVLFENNNYYNAISYYDSRRIDSLSLLGVLTGKQFKVQPHSDGTSYPIIFNVKIIKTNNLKYDIFENEKFKLNDTIEINMHKYIEYREN